MEKNHICKKCGGIAGWDSYFQSWICTRCGNEEPKPITHYDLLIRKTPEEMAKFLTEYRCVHKAPHCKEANCEQCWLNWLKQEAEKGET